MSPQDAPDLVRQWDFQHWGPLVGPFERAVATEPPQVSSSLNQPGQSEQWMVGKRATCVASVSSRDFLSPPPDLPAFRTIVDPSLWCVHPHATIVSKEHISSWSHFLVSKKQLEQLVPAPLVLAPCESGKKTFIDTNYGQGLPAAFMHTSSVLWLTSSEKRHNKRTFIRSH